MCEAADFMPHICSNALGICCNCCTPLNRLGENKIWPTSLWNLVYIYARKFVASSYIISVVFFMIYAFSSHPFLPTNKCALAHIAENIVFVSINESLSPLGRERNRRDACIASAFLNPSKSFVLQTNSTLFMRFLPSSYLYI